MHTEVRIMRLRYGQITPDPRLDGYEPYRDPWSFPTYDEQKKHFLQEKIAMAVAMTPFHQRLPDEDKKYLKSVAAYSIGKSLGLDETQLKEFAESTIDNNADKTIVETVKQNLKTVKQSPNYSSKMMECAIVDAISAVHNAYNAGLIEDVKQGKQYEVLRTAGFYLISPIEIAGFVVAKDHFLDYVRPVLSQLGDNTKWRDEYYRRSESLLRNCDIKNPHATYSGLQDFLILNNVGECFYGSTNQKIEMADRAMENISYNGIISDWDFMDRLRDDGVDFIQDYGVLEQKMTKDERGIC